MPHMARPDYFKMAHFIEFKIIALLAVEPWHIKNGGIVFQLSMYMQQKIGLSKRNGSIQISSSQNDRRNVIDDGMEQLREIPCEEWEMLACAQLFF